MTGLREKTIDERDFQTGAIFELPELKELPAKYFVAPLSVKDQMKDRNFDFCAACAGAGLCEPKEEVELYYPFLFAAAKFESGDDLDSFGLQIRDVGKALQKWGVPEVNDVPQSVLNLTEKQRRDFRNYPESLRKAAEKHKADSYAFINGPYDTYDNVRALIWKFRELKQQVIFGVHWNWSNKKYDLFNGTKKGQGHAMWVNGWDEAGIICTNSAGVKAGKNGTHRMDRQTFNQGAEYFGSLMIVDMAPEAIRNFLNEGAKTTDSWFVKLLKSLKGILLSPLLTPSEKLDIIIKTADMKTLHSVALEHVGRDASPKDTVPDDVACAESVTNIIREVLPDFPIITGTWTLWSKLASDPRFKQVEGHEPGRIVISPTGMGNGRISNGHVGICTDNEMILSNTSKSGIWEENYRISTWNDRFKVKGGYPVYYFELIK